MVSAAPDDATRTISSPRVTFVDKATGHVHNVLRCGFENPSAAERINIEAKLRALALAQTNNPTAATGLTITPAMLTAAADAIKAVASQGR